VLYEKHAATFLQQLRKIKGFKYFEHTKQHTPYQAACFSNIVCILVIFRISGKYPIRKINGIHGPREW